MSHYAHFHLVKIGGEECQKTTYYWKNPRNQNHNFDLLLCNKQAVPQGLGYEDVPVQSEEHGGKHSVQVGKG